jgi:hypothetical protein
MIDMTPYYSEKCVTIVKGESVKSLNPKIATLTQMNDDLIAELYKYAFWIKFGTAWKRWRQEGADFKKPPQGGIDSSIDLKGVAEGSCCWRNLAILRLPTKSFQLLILHHEDCSLDSEYKTKNLNILKILATEWLTSLYHVGGLKTL